MPLLPASLLRPLRVVLLACLPLTLLLPVTPVHGWKEWVWENASGTLEWPEARSGHSMVMQGSKIIVFGGMSDDTWQPHIPKTYGITRKDGSLEVTSYDKFMVKEACNASLSDKDCQACTLEPDGGANCPMCCIRVGRYFNDVWAYDLDCTRWDDLACQTQGWTRLDPGAPLGGCTIVNLVEECPKPTERYNHAAEVFANGKMYIYGGFSQFCEDYCEDMWSFDVNKLVWLKIVSFDYIQPHPGKRWRFATAMQSTRMFVFGGHRLWHGYDGANSEENGWSEFSTKPCPPEEWDVDSTIQYVTTPRTKLCKDRGGYLDDLWEYNQVTGLWRQYAPKITTLPDIWEAWDDRFNKRNVTYWPKGRAGHAMLLAGECGFPEKLDEPDQRLAIDQGKKYATEACNIFVFGGYRTEFPYPTTGSFGAGKGTQRTANLGYAPYPSLPFYLNDLWRYNLKTGYWVNIKFAAGSPKPPPRFDHSFVMSGTTFILFGGYSSNYQLSDVWYFNQTTNRWLEKTTFVHASYPKSCDDDFTCHAEDHIQYYVDPRNKQYVSMSSMMTSFIPVVLESGL